MNARDLNNAAHEGWNQSTAQRIENALHSLGAVMADDRIPLAVRDLVCLAHRQLHACRDELTVRRMEVRMGLKK